LAGVVQKLRHGIDLIISLAAIFKVGPCPADKPMQLARGDAHRLARMGARWRRGLWGREVLTIRAPV